MSSVLARLARLELIVVTGKGGTGKTTLAAALGFALHARGRRVLVLEADPRESLHQMYGVAPSGGEVVPVAEGLALQNVSPRRVVDAIVRERLRFGPLLKRTLASPVYQHFVEGAPGLRELALLAHAERAVHGTAPAPQGLAGGAHVVVLDAPASGHARSLLAAPALVAETVRAGPFAELAGALAAWIGDVERVGVVLVTLAEELPVAEALELEHALVAQRARGAEAVLANELYPPLPLDGGARRARAEDDPALALWRARRGANERELARLRAALATPILELALLPLARGPELGRALAELLAGEPS